MGKKLTKKLLVFLTLMCMIIGMNVSVSAETGSTGNTKAISAAENPADGTLQVWLEYEDDNGNSVALSGGSCFLINEEYVLSNYHIFNLNEEIAPGVTIRSAAMETLGLSELKDNDPHLKIRVYANRDMSVLATIHDSVQSQTMDYVAMKLSDKIYDRKPLALGDSSTVQQTQTVNAYGFPEDSIENKEFNTAADVSATDGTISKLTVGGRADFFEHTAQLNHGNSGGPLVDSNKSVIGVNTFTYGNSSDQKYYAVQINAIKSGLDTFGISYINAGAQATTQTPDEEEPEEKEGPDADLVTALKSEITKAKAVDTKNYTEESVKVLNDTISEAEKVANDTEATDAQVTSATSDVKAAVENLEEKSGMNFLLIGGIAADADYTFDVDYTDLAGNAAADYTQDKFTVDKTDPEVEFFDIEDKSANNGTVAPGVKYSDVNYMESGVDITIKGAKHDKTELSGNRTNIANGESIKMEDFKHDEETDDVYTMTAVIKDKAGNETEKEVMFSVNRFGSNYIFSETTEKFLDDVYANKPKDLVVTEVNVDSLVFNGISYGLDGTKKELKAGSDYTVKQSGGEGSWKEYTYTIKKENFEKEGRYSVTIDSEDKATNKMNNKVKECNIDFVIDKTPPTVVITGIEESSYRADEREMTINLSDNTAVKCVDVIIDGKSVATYAQKEIEKAGGKISYMIEGASEPQKIEAAALDMAGNETTSEMHKVLVTSSVWIQYINNTPLLIGSILGIVLVAGGLIWFFVIRKKKEESK